MAQDIDTDALIACTICRDVQNFDLLIEDMESVLGEAWGDLGLADSLAFFSQPEADSLEFVVLAIDGDDEGNLVMLSEIISLARKRDIAVILVAEEDVSPPTLHTLTRKSDGEFIPYPLPEGELLSAVERIRQRNAAPVPVPAEPVQMTRRPSRSKDGGVIVVHGLAGGAGSTTLAVNLAWELAELCKDTSQTVCLIDLDMQFGNISTCLDLPRKDAVYEMLSETETMDEEIFHGALQSYENRISVLTSPADMLPLELLSQEDIERVLDMCRSQFDYVVIDMPTTLVHWTETVLHHAHVYVCPIELDMRSAQNTLRFKRALQSEEMPTEKLRYVLNRAPKFTDLTNKTRVKKMAESLGISIDLHLPDGGKQVTQSADHGQPLALSAPKNPLRKEITRLAQQLQELQDAAAEAA